MKSEIKGPPVFFDPVKLGESLTEVAVDVISTESQDILSKWFHSDQDVDLHVWFDAKNKIIKQQIIFFGQIVEWNIVEGIKTGVMVEEESPVDSAEAVETKEKILYDKEIQFGSVQQGVELIKNIRKIDLREKSKLLHNFLKESPFIFSMTTDYKRSGVFSVFADFLRRLFR